MQFNQIIAALGTCLLISAAPTPSPVKYAARLEKRSVPASIDDFNELHRAAQLSAAAYAGCSKGAFDVTIVQQIDNSTTYTQGYIRYSTSIRESRWHCVDLHLVMIDFINDLNTTLVTPTLSGVNFPSGAQIIMGI
ncbi:uncharacterized protein BDZ99DRAFT_473554 [Mytilinidion resinicola]|uniref:Ecp2 effector protein domain-containing protein n=1 Tax=Mytilinidion resinicola TaxID=574789 RepID=A0A6A6YXW6_9PEZI|nr:uncharacterized protein BDZ99DRAFT_473554 [Mytilinidion resinicola]KAF2812777.1 hypothetical protein BDZ99DRAFT_473554 [Mytilinidion resinicola]